MELINQDSMDNQWVIKGEFMIHACMKQCMYKSKETKWLESWQVYTLFKWEGLVRSQDKKYIICFHEPETIP